MMRVLRSLLAATCVAGLAAPRVMAQAPSPHPSADTARHGYTAAGVRFMSGMIYHHAQAILIAGWARSHGAGPAAQTLCERIVASQTDDIKLLSRWLADRHAAAPHPRAAQ